jgi:hypothetical protein
MVIFVFLGKNCVSYPLAEIPRDKTRQVIVPLVSDLRMIA